ncbi:MAG: prepilin-type N-terminal cleavage/methylation domain-containing protein [Deltaproteobacteria bacterium]|nr:prepilin-type N-terminal cleavage/methylation domain-containing protein [Deltaproteobacteria bacterium]
MKARRPSGFTLVELMIVLTIIGILASLAIPSYDGQVKLARRTEATVGLDATYKAQMAYLGEFGSFATNYSDLQKYLSIPGSQLVSANELRTGKYTLTLAQPWGTGSWQVTASGQLDGDPWLDVIVGDYNRP